MCVFGCRVADPIFPQATNLWSRDAQIRKQFQGVSTHEPDIFTLPRDHNIAQQPMLQVRALA